MIQRSRALWAKYWRDVGEFIGCGSLVAGCFCINLMAGFICLGITALVMVHLTLPEGDE